MLAARSRLGSVTSITYFSTDWPTHLGGDDGDYVLTYGPTHLGGDDGDDPAEYEAHEDHEDLIRGHPAHEGAQQQVRALQVALDLHDVLVDVLELLGLTW